MRFTKRVHSIAGDSSPAWDTHYQALADQESDADVLVLSVGDPDFDTPAEVRQAAVNALNQGDTHYTPILGRDALRELIASNFNAASACDVTADNA